MNDAERIDRYIPPGSKVWLADDEGDAEYGIVIHCWNDGEIGGFDCYGAFFGSTLPSGKPEDKPYVLRYAASSLTLIET